MSTTKTAILQMKINGALADLYARTNYANVYNEDGTKTLTAEISDILSAIDALPTTEEVNAAIKAADDTLYNKILGKVDDTTTIDEAFDTLKEVADWIKTHGDVATAFRSDITDLQGRMTAAEGEIDALQTDLSEAEGNITDLQGRMTTAEGEIDALQSSVDAIHTHDNKTVLDGITAEKVSAWDSNATIKYVNGADTEVDLSTVKDNDLVIRLLD